MRLTMAIVFAIMIVALIICAIMASRSKKAIGLVVAFAVTCIIFPIVGNLIITVSTSEKLSTIGYYIYFIGMDMIMYSMFYFALRYCRVKKSYKFLRILVVTLSLIDVVQLLLNPLLHHAFATERIVVYGADYYRLIPYFGQTFHRVVCYGILAMIFVIFLIRRATTPRIYAERYSSILICMLIAAIAETYFIFSKTPIDISMIAFGIFGLTLYYFAIHYRSLRLLDRMLSDLVSEMTQSIMFFDSHGGCIWANDAAVAQMGIDRRNFELADAKIEEMFPNLPTINDWTQEYTKGEGEDFRYYILKKQAVRDARGRVTGSFLGIEDKTSEYQELAQQRYLARHDSLTGLYNRDYLYKRILERIDEHPQEGYYIGFLNVKNFKMVNDVFGNAFGDYTLKCIADKLREFVPEGGIYGRITGDLFGFLVPISHFNQERLVKNMTAFVVEEGDVSYSPFVQIGIYEIARGDRDVAVMFDRAHMALTSIKDDYTERVAYYDDHMRSQVLWEQMLSAQVEKAIEEKQIRPYYQPIVDAKGKVVGAEALARWRHPEKGFLNPSDFIPVFEKNGMIADVDRSIWRSACEKLASWKKEGRDMFLSVNISPKDFYFMDVAEELVELTKEYEIDPKNLRVEITETVMMSDIKNRLGILRRLKKAGFIVEMDDFGSGFSSLNLLKDMPVDVLKIDMLFLRESAEKDRARTIVRNIIKLSHDLRMTSLTEGVETEEQFKALADMGCHLFQGFYFAKPMTDEEFEEFCRKEK